MKKFKPSLALSATLLPLLLLFLWLGQWQAQRKTEKQDLFDQFNQAPEQSLQSALRNGSPFSRITVSGRFDLRRHVLLDNKVFKGRAGVHVLTPFSTTDGQLILVNRGWLPLPPDRSSLPDVPTTGDTVEITGLLSQLPGAGPRLGDADRMVADQWPQLITYFDHEPVQQALGSRLEQRIVLLDPTQPMGFDDRNWQPATMTPQVHGAYAVQWYSLAIATICIWIVLGIRRAK